MPGGGEGPRGHPPDADRSAPPRLRQGVFLRNLSWKVLEDDLLAHLLTYPNVIVTSHQAFFTEDAVASIAETTLSNIRDVEQGKQCPNEVKPE